MSADGFTIRFLPVDPWDPHEPALYLSGDETYHDRNGGLARRRLTSVSSDLWTFPSKDDAAYALRAWSSVDYARLDVYGKRYIYRATIVPLDVANADLSAGPLREPAKQEPRPAPWHSVINRAYEVPAHVVAWRSCSAKARHAGRRR